MTRFPASPPPLSNQDAYTTWPGGVDPTARLYNSVGGAKRRLRTRRRRAASRKTRRRAASRR